MRGYFGIGVERISKIMNIGSLFRSAHAFGASFIFTIGANYTFREGQKSDTSHALEHIPFYSFPDASSFSLPKGCNLVAVELLDGALDLPNFYHPQQAAYILGPERGQLSKELLDRCDYNIKIPTKFCINLGIAGSIVMYDRLQSHNKLARHQDRSLKKQGNTLLSKTKQGLPDNKDVLRNNPTID
ncbi:MAG: hypothetical protein CFH06_00123 [Alphaproteobacteria bacterium MarineAlpha3_Bin5]|nr:RNA methyltransferase [Magnetovibrio sp.]PPR80120.1 MAG: hypothetical protein CFH06_00123 [Alphaproteobacteria bacterium MarineAlpha3_Bin5]